MATVLSREPPFQCILVVDGGGATPTPAIHVYMSFLEKD